MEPTLPNKTALKERAIDGDPITQTEASTLASAESDLTGSGPIKGGTAATAQSVYDKQQNFLEKAGEVARKPTDQVTKEDAAQVQSAESRFIGGRPPKGSATAAAQSLAAENEKN